ncbi:DoxX family protein [Rubellimicrobium arenae]|uniref:DoxX family protein n=1 Tax=Rubellimicrobium arenae TaxID=2817372 RepID=UPI001B30DAC2|nr:DoxX family protein [Rubellimicrobium arenae]
MTSPLALDAWAGRAGVTLLRVSLGTMFLAHSVVLKLFTYTLPGTAAFFEGVGLPGWLAYVTFAAEAAGGLALVLGIQARWVAMLLSPFLLGALVTVHWANGWVFTAAGGGWEYPAYLFVLCLAQALLGDGAWALSPSISLGRLFGLARPQPRLG